MDVGGKNNRVKDNFKVFGVSNWTMEWIFFFFFGEGLNCRKKWLKGGKCSVTPVYVKFEMPVSYFLGDSAVKNPPAMQEPQDPQV